MSDLVIAGGQESMSLSLRVLPGSRDGQRMGTALSLRADSADPAAAHREHLAHKAGRCIAGQVGGEQRVLFT